MIYTLTTNPAVDLTLSSGELKCNCVTRTKDAIYTPNGKGVNVSFALKTFGIDSTVLGFFGGFTGEYIVSECKRAGFNVSPVMIDGITRVNVFLNDGSGEYNLVGEGPTVSENKKEEFLKLLENLETPEYLCISGSLPKGIETDYYDKILQACARMGTKVILDISSPKLKELIAYRPLLIKPNDDELKQIFGLSTDTEDEIISSLNFLHKMGAQNILLTLGSRGSYFYNGKDIYSCGIYPIKILSTGCAGDASLAAFLSVWLKDKNNISDALKLGAGAGANVAESAGLGDLKMAREYAKTIEVKKL